MIHKNQFIELSFKNFKHNSSKLKTHTNKNIIAVVKSNAYGHGIKEISLFADQDLNISIIATHSFSEALMLRKKNIKKKILVLAHLDKSPVYAKKLDISVVVYNFEQLDLALKYNYNFHLKFNTGLNRLGFNDKDTKDIIDFLKKNKLEPEGIFSHFAESENQNISFTEEQIKEFNNIIKQFKETNINCKYIHISNSTAFLRSLDSIYSNTIRCGGSLLGLKKNLYSKEFEVDLLPVLSWYSPIIEIRTVEAGESIGYNRTFTTKTESKIAIVATGYFDGYSSELSNCGSVAINNQFAPVVGKICMNMFMIDITKITNLKIGNLVELIGPNLTIDKMCELIKQPIYATSCKINSQIKKIIVTT